MKRSVAALFVIFAVAYSGVLLARTKNVFTNGAEKARDNLETSGDGSASGSGLDSHIKSFQVFGKSSGIAFTPDALFRTDNNGQSWAPINLQKGRSQKISHVYFTDADSGWLLLADRGRSTLEIRRTRDGGISWTADPVAIEAEALGEADLENALLLYSSSSSEWLLTVPLQTSSNFTGRLLFVSTDGGQTWELRSRTVGLNTPDVEAKAELASGGWTLKTDGICLTGKTGCVQETTLFRAGIEITPPPIKELARIEKEKARLQAESTPMFALGPGGSTRISLNRGFDMCNAPTAAQMQTWWNNSPLYDMNIYMSGRNRACSAQPNLSASWVTQTAAMGWGLIPTVVGYQSPCTASTTTVKLSYDTAVAEQQGRGEADIAVTDANNLGLTTGSILYYDMERYDPPSPDTLGCRVATVAFLKGWTDRIRELGYRSGVYGSPKNAQEDWVNLPPPSKMDAIWMARWDNVPSVWTYITFPTFPTLEWANHQRIKQWQAPHNETWGGVTFNIDGNTADGPVAGAQVQKNKNADFDGDGRSDVSVYRPDTGVWYVTLSSNSSVSIVGFGVGTDIITPGDYDGDGKTDHSVFRPVGGVWHILTKAGFYTSRQFGSAGDIPVPADFNGDGRADIAVYRPSSGVWYVMRSSDGGVTSTRFGLAADLPAEGDFDGDGKYDFVVYRDGIWYLQQTTLGFSALQFGQAGDLPVTGDFDGDNKADISVFRPSSGVWYLLRSQSGFYAAAFGLSGDRPVPRGYLPQ